MAKKNGGGGLSLRTADAVEGGGTEGALATIEEIECVEEFTYGGTQRDNPSAAIRVTFDIEGFKKPWEQHYSFGPSKNFKVIEEGAGIKSLRKSEGISKRCPAYYLLESIEQAAEAAKLDLEDLLPELEDGGNSVKPLEGKRVRLTNKTYKTVGGDDKEYIVIGEFVDDEKPARSNGNGKSSTKASNKQSSSDDIDEKTVAAVEALIEEHTSVKKGDLANLVYQANRKDPDAKAMMQLCFKDAWVADEDRPWSFDKKKGVLRAKED